MQRIEILSTEVRVNSGTSSRTGKQYSMREQSAALHDTKKKYPEACRISLNRDQEPYPVGMYEIESPLSVGNYESLQSNRDLGLRLIEPQKQRAAA